MHLREGEVYLGPWSMETVCHSGEGVLGRAAPLCGGCLLLSGWVGSLPSVSPPQGYSHRHIQRWALLLPAVFILIELTVTVIHHTYLLVCLWLAWIPNGTFYSKIVYGSQKLEVNKMPINWWWVSKMYIPIQWSFPSQNMSKMMIYTMIGLNIDYDKWKKPVTKHWIMYFLLYVMAGIDKSIETGD